MQIFGHKVVDFEVSLWNAVGDVDQSFQGPSDYESAHTGATGDVPPTPGHWNVELPPVVSKSVSSSK